MDVARSWVISYFGNLAGILCFMAVICGCKHPPLLPLDLLWTDRNLFLDGGVFSTGAYKAESIAFAVKKCVTPQWHQIMLRAIGGWVVPPVVRLAVLTHYDSAAANWLVCLAVFMATSSREIVSKIVAIWWPITTFVALGLDHVIANMFLIPM